MAILICLSAFIFCLMESAYSNQVAASQSELSGVREQLQAQQDLVAQHSHVISEVQKTLARIEHDEAEQEHTIRQQGETIGALERLVQQQGTTIGKLERMVAQISTPDTLIDEYTVTGCLADVISLFCPNERVISVTSAVYGMYNPECPGEDCCTTQASDCTEDVAENKPSDWIGLKLQCDNSTSCSYQYSGAIIDSCQENYLADYMQIYFNCLPDVESEAIGFSAYTEEIRPYPLGAIVQFPDVITNLGNHYNNSTGHFHCPYYGTYMFSINFCAYWEEEVDLDVLRNGTTLVRAWAGAVPNLYNHASAFVITECLPGETIYAQTNVASVMTGSPLSHFSGYLLQRYE